MKYVIIDCCDQCRYCDNDVCFHPKRIKKLSNEDLELDIPTWCPLEDVEGDD